jgi:glycine/D-amino acid oxidase-like deaminating enzyme
MSATIHKDLHFGRSIWQARRLSPTPTTRLRGRSAVDVLIVGAGISGAMMADALSDAGCRVLVVDRRRPFTGSTTASTALIQHEIDTPMQHLIPRIGRRRTERIWRRSKLALDALIERVHALDIAAEAMALTSVYLAGDVLGPAGLTREAECRRQAGFEVQILSAAEVRVRYGIDDRAALVAGGSLAADPRRLAHGFLRAAITRGARLAWPVQVVDVQPGRSHVTARTASGEIVTARHLMFATGYELPKGVPRAGHSLASTWAIATRPQRRWSWPTVPGVVWEASDPYLYLRPGPDGRLICGGEDASMSDAAARDALLPRKTAILERKLAALLPRVDARADYAWCGTFGGSTTGTPSIGPVPRMPGCFAVLGYGGNGITFAALAAQIARNYVLGQRDADADLFSFRRRR